MTPWPGIRRNVCRIYWCRNSGPFKWHLGLAFWTLDPGLMTRDFFLWYEFKRWVLSLGPEAVVLQPEKLKGLVRQDLSKNLAQYSSKGLPNILRQESQAI